MITRFAPSPTGYLHLGHALSALTAFDAARAMGGVCLLRIEDTDQGRCRPAFDEAILEDLRWLGLSWPEPVWRQSQRMAVYAATLDGLIASGLMYRCFRTRRSLMEDIANAPHDSVGAVRPGPLEPEAEAEALAQGAPFAWRLSLDRCRETLGARWDALAFEADGVVTPAKPERLGDVILARKEFPASYHLASVVDDGAQGVTHIIRGEDLRDAAHLHVLLQALLGLPTPIYRHHPLLTGADGKRLSKRDGATALRALREAGRTPADVRAMVGL